MALEKEMMKLRPNVGLLTSNSIFKILYHI